MRRRGGGRGFLAGGDAGVGRVFFAGCRVAVAQCAAAFSGLPPGWSGLLRYYLALLPSVFPRGERCEPRRVQLAVSVGFVESRVAPS